MQDRRVPEARYLFIEQALLELMPSFLAQRKKTKTKRPVNFKTRSGKDVGFKARRKPKRRVRVSF